MTAKKKFLILFTLWGLSLIGLSYTSHYSVTGSVGDVNFEIATMLAPSGLINNFFIAKDHYLKPYYSNVAETHHTLWSDPTLLISFILFISLSLLLLMSLRKKSHG